MFNFFQRHVQYISRGQAGSAGTGLLINGLLCVLFGLAIFMQPELLSFLVATLLIIFGVTLLTTWWKIRNWR